MSASATSRRLRCITPTEPRRIGRKALSAATRPHIRGKISPKPGRITVHIVDTLEMAAAFGLDIHPALAKSGDLDVKVNFDPYGSSGIAQLIDTWIPLSNALNNLNRTMGRQDLYPFILSPPVIAKLAAIHQLVHASN
jgi:hypothetical protein